MHVQEKSEDTYTMAKMFKHGYTREDLTGKLCRCLLGENTCASCLSVIHTHDFLMNFVCISIYSWDSTDSSDATIIVIDDTYIVI